MDQSLAHLESWAQLEPQLLETRRCSMIPLGIYSHGTNPLEASTKVCSIQFPKSLPTDVLKGKLPSPTRCLPCTLHSQVPNLVQLDPNSGCLACQRHCAAEWRSRGGRRCCSQSRLPFPPLPGCPSSRSQAWEEGRAVSGERYSGTWGHEVGTSQALISQPPHPASAFPPLSPAAPLSRVQSADSPT